ncbi:uncharacterized protein LOC111695829 isoform X4 [Eurytemora carolleeae]|nr:uncharacterized protein LOC111695829 isoform X2 [Eurytemora carolleeae]XP_023321049.1 uncharacterized protein LOC111695829 isoform X3 [Eurytemora carolleeae]XP_023321050.1 uncharacterized protein LOC111695829 isoform X4 [Eurytemora carolleeae]|eukprot:XP_023321047.1 uncharacterized protein LOC111695829 isoform X2 [Eurytemora affinis]
MMETFKGSQEHVDLWLNAADGKNSAEDWTTFFKKEGYISGVDYPFSLFWKDLVTVYPNAKVVLSTREPEKWYTSVYESIWQVQLFKENSWTAHLLFKMLDKKRPVNWMAKLMETKGPGMDLSMHEAITAGPDTAKQYFIDWEENVKASISAERLLVHSAKEGWKPLCDFLGFDIPDEPYPRVNDTASIQKAVRMIKLLNFGIFYVAPVLVGVAVYSWQDCIWAGLGFHL